MRALLIFAVACSAPAKPAPPPHVEAVAPAPGVAAAPAPDAAPTPDAPCEPLPAEARTRKGDYAITHDYAAVRVFHVDGACATQIALIDTRSRLAFAEILDGPPGAPPPISVDTWLMHGDRLRRDYTWSAGHYDAGPESEVPGPRKFTPHK